jgi:hypothetical protein
LLCRLEGGRKTSAVATDNQTAKALGLSVPLALLASADEVSNMDAVCCGA